MTRPDRRQRAAMPAALAGAVDLSGLKARAEAAAAGPSSNGGTPPPTTTSEWVVDVSEATFQAEVVERSLQVPVVLDLWAEWCQPCKQLSPVLEKLAAAGRGAWILAKVDIEANPRIAQLFGVQSIPMVVAVAGGQPVDAFQGALPEPQVRQWITSLVDALRDRLPGIAAAEGAAAEDGEVEPVEEPADPRFVAAEDAIERGDYAAAEAAYQVILAAEPANEQAAEALLQVRFAARTENADPAAVATADANPGDVDAQLAAADVEVAMDQADAAFARLVAVVRRTAGDDRDRARERLLSLLALFPGDDPRVLTARRSLAAALY